MILVKRTAGAPLSEAERRQRRNAARARWAGAAGLAGAAIGSEISLHHAVTAEHHRARLAAVDDAERLRANDLAVLAGAERRRNAIAEAIRHRMSGRPGGPPETAAQRAARTQAALDPTAPRVPPRRVSNAPVVGTVRNKLIYDYEIAGLSRQLRREQAQLARDTLTHGEDTEHPDLRRQRARVRALETDLAQLQRLRDRAPQPRGRAATVRQQGGQQVPVAAHVEQRFRRGETQAQIRARIAGAKDELRGRERNLLDLLERRTAKVRAATHQRTVSDIEAAIAHSFRTGEYGSRVLRARGRGGLIGAGIGLTAAGIGILAHHVATAGSPVEKLAKASDAPEDRIGRGLAMQFRQWIDRLLGRNDAAMDLGDGFATAMAPGITQAFTDGLRGAPIVQPDPRYRVDVDFDVINPSVRRHMAEYALDRIVQISDAQREAIRQAVLQGPVLQGIGPLEAARAIRQSIGLTSYQQSVVQSFRVALQQLDPRVLERKLRDRRYDRTLKAAIDTNTPLSEEQLNQMVDAYHRRMLALRAQTIARTEALRATSFGGLARAQEVLDENQGLEVTKRWLATKDDRTRDTHRDLDGKEVDGMTGHFITSAGNLIRWPLDETAPAAETINCRCTLQYIFTPKRGQLMAVAA